MTEMSEQNTFEWPIRVYYEDTDLQGVVYYANYFRYMERARTEWLRSLGVEQDRMLEQERRYFVVVDTYAKFLKPARFNEMLVATARLTAMTKASFKIEQNIYRSSVDGDCLCRGYITAAYVDADTQRALRIPASIFEDNNS